MALAYYDSRLPERAAALLYKARLEVETGCPERAIAHLQEGLEILQHFPEAEEIRRHTLSSLGNLYFENSHYEDARRMHLALWPLCHTDKDKAVALNALSAYPVSKTTATRPWPFRDARYATHWPAEIRA